MVAEGVAGLVGAEEDPSEITHGTNMSLLSVTGTHRQQRSSSCLNCSSKKDGNMNRKVLQLHNPAVFHLLGLSSAENLCWTSGMSQLSQFSNH